MKSPGPGLGDELELVAPAHPRSAAHDVDHAFDRAVVMRAGLGLRMDHDRAGPELLGAGARMGDRRRAVHAGRLRRVDVELVRRARRARRRTSTSACRGRGSLQGELALAGRRLGLHCADKTGQTDTRGVDCGQLSHVFFPVKGNFENFTPRRGRFVWTIALYDRKDARLPRANAIMATGVQDGAVTIRASDAGVGGR